MQSGSTPVPELLRKSLATAQIRTARPTHDLARARAFYESTLGLPVLAEFENHEGYDGIVFGLPDPSRQLELVHSAHVTPAPTPEDQTVVYLGSNDAVETISNHLERHGRIRLPNPNPYWESTGAIAFTDPDGYWLILSPQSW